MIIRPMLSGDVVACAEFMAATPLWQRYGVTIASATERFEQGLADQATIAVAEVEVEVEVEDKPAGFVWTVQNGAFNRSGYIMLIGVWPELRGQGVGAALMAHAEELLFATSPHIFLLVSDFNHAAQRFYQRLGYVQVGAIPDYVTVGITELVFCKSIYI